MSVRNEEKKELKSVLVKQDPQFWASLSQDQRDKALRMMTGAVSSVTFQQSTSVYSGPIPSPEMFDEYNRAMPDGADRVMRMAEEQSRHRMRLESQTIASQNTQSARGQIFAFVSVLVLICSGSWAAYIHETAVACTIFGTTVLGMGGVFAYGKFVMRRNLAKKSEGNQ